MCLGGAALPGTLSLANRYVNAPPGSGIRASAWARRTTPTPVSAYRHRVRHRVTTVTAVPIVRPVVLLALLLSVLLAGCSGDDTAPPPTAEPSSSSPTAVSAATEPAEVAPARPDGPVADLSEELVGGNGPFVGSGNLRLDDGYVEEEYVAAGRASAYSPVGELTADGLWTFEPGEKARYRTRVLVRRPADPADASGVVLVEWLNVSGGLDADPEFQTLREEIVREGHTWVGVSAQQIGVEGGPVAVTVDVPGAGDVVGQGLKAIDPDRYGSLAHPGDAYSYDIYTQVARAVRDQAPADARVVAVGESQSAFALVTYVNGVQPLTRAFDGFFVHSRGAAPLALPEDGKPADIAGSLFGTPTTFRTDTDVPVFDLQTETDVAGILGSAFARQPDSDLFRLWEVAGTGHADRHLLGDTAAAIDCGPPVNDGPLHVVAKAAFHHFVTWLEDGVVPPTAALLTYDADGVQRDGDGIALGGLRTAPVDVPVRVLSGAPGREDDPVCLLFGSTLPLPAGRLAELYPDRATYVAAYDDAVDEAIAAGYVLEDDRAALEAYRHEELVRP